MVSYVLRRSGIWERNPTKSVHVSEFHAGLKKTAMSKGHVPQRACAISMPMLNLMHEWCDHQKEKVLNDVACKTFKAVSSFAFGSFGRIDEVVKLKYGSMQLDRSRASSLNPSVHLKYHQVVFKERKNQVGDNRPQRFYDNVGSGHSKLDVQVKQHIDEYRTIKKHKGFNETSDNMAFTRLKGVPNFSSNDGPEKALKWLKKNSGCYGVSFDPTKPANDSSMLSLLNLIRCFMLNDSEFWPLDDQRREWFLNIKFTTHCFRRGGAQHRFSHADPKYRWSLTMIKRWGGWSASDNNDVLIKYLLNETCHATIEVLADALAPDKFGIKSGCPSRWIDEPANSEDLNPIPTPQLLLDEIKVMKALLNRVLEGSQASIDASIGINPLVIPDLAINGPSTTTDHTCIPLLTPIEPISIYSPTKDIASTDFMSIATKDLPTLGTWQDAIRFYLFMNNLILHDTAVKYWERGATKLKQRATVSRVRRIGRSFEACVYQTLWKNLWKKISRFMQI